MADTRDDLAMAQAPFMRGLKPVERQALMEQRSLRRKAKAKQARAEAMLFTALGCMQMTSQSLGEAKALRFANRGLKRIVDYTCGMGGDTLHAPPNLEVIGVDRDEATLLCYRHNARLHRDRVLAVLGDATRSPVRANACLLDPARRPKAGMNHWDGDGMVPGWDDLESLVGSHEAVGIKLGPGLTPPEVFNTHEFEYLGLNDACLELMIWAGALGDAGMIRATEWPSGESVVATRQERDESFIALSAEAADAADSVEAGGGAGPGTYLYEPVKCVVRAHLHGILAYRYGLRLLDPRIAYLTGDLSIESPLLKRYAILREMPHDLGEIRTIFKREGIGVVTVKKRGSSIVPEQVRAKVRHAGVEGAATLVFTRMGERRKVFWVKPEGAAAGRGESVGDVEGGLADDEMVA